MQSSKTQHISVYTLALYATLFLIFPLMTSAQTVNIPDPNLRAAIAEALGKASNARITADEMATLTNHLDANNRGIKDLTGLEAATSLDDLGLNDNLISDISPLAGLIRLRHIELENNAISDLLYCHRKFGPLSKTRLWYNIHLLERSIRWRNANEETSLPSLKPKLFLRHSAVKVRQQKCVGDITSAMNNFQSGSASFLKMRRPSLNPLINSLMPTERIAQLEQLVGRLTLALDIQKKASTYLS